MAPRQRFEMELEDQSLREELFTYDDRKRIFFRAFIQMSGDPSHVRSTLIKRKAATEAKAFPPAE